MHTVEQAKATWCPHARVNVGGSYSVNRIWQKFKEWADGRDKEFHVEQEANLKCIGPACSQWRWIMQVQHGAGASFDREGGLCWTGRDGKLTSTPPETARGFCGIAPIPTR